MSVNRLPRNPESTTSLLPQRRLRSPVEVPSNLPPRKRTRIGHTPPPDHVPAIPEGALAPSFVATAMAPSPAPMAVDDAASSSLTDVEIVESATVSNPRPIHRQRPSTATRPSAAARPRPPAKSLIKGKGKRKEKTPEAPTTNFVPVREPAEILSSVPSDLLDEVLPTVNSPPYPCLQCVFSGATACVFKGWDRVCERCKGRHLKCSYVQKNNDDLFMVRERLLDQVRGSPSGKPVLLFHLVFF